MDFLEQKIEETIKTMESKEDFCSFLNLLVLDYDENQEFWQNQDLQSFLIALRDYSAGEGGYLDDPAMDNRVSRWSTFAEMLCAARAFG